VLISVVVLGVLASLDPLRPAVFVLVLRTQLVNAIAFLAGWTVALLLLFVIVCVALAGDLSAGLDAGQRTAASVAELLIGAALLAVAAHRWRHRRDQGATRGYPRAVLARLEHLDVRTAAALGVLIQPRSLTIAAAVVVARDGAGVFGLLVGFAAFAVVSTAALLGILLYDICRPESARARLAVVVSELERRGPTTFTVLAAAGGGYLVLDALRTLLR
jgi:hypothetical protein